VNRADEVEICVSSVWTSNEWPPIRHLVRSGRDSVEERLSSQKRTNTQQAKTLDAQGFLSATIQHVGDRITQPSDQVPGAGIFVSGLPFGGAPGTDPTAVDLELDPYVTLNLSAGVEYETWEAILYVNNVTDENADLSFDRERGGRARLGFRTNQPRTVGLTFRKSF